MIGVALSLRQPWAELVVAGLKPIENRGWYTTHRGPLFIHASTSVDVDGLVWINDNAEQLCLPPDVRASINCPRRELERGGLIGLVDLVGVIRASESPWFFGPYGFVLERPARLPFLRMHGQLGVFNVAVASSYSVRGVPPLLA